MAAVKDRGLFPGLGIRRHAPLKILADDVRRAGQLRVLVAQLLFKFPVVIPLVIGHGRVIVPAARLLILQLMPFVIGIGNEGQRRRIVAVGAVVFIILVPLRQAGAVIIKGIVVDVGPDGNARIPVISHIGIDAFDEEALVIIPGIDVARRRPGRALQTAPFTGLFDKADAVAEEMAVIDLRVGRGLEAALAMIDVVDVFQLILALVRRPAIVIDEGNIVFLHTGIIRFYTPVGPAGSSRPAQIIRIAVGTPLKNLLGLHIAVGVLDVAKEVFRIPFDVPMEAVIFIDVIRADHADRIGRPVIAQSIGLKIGHILIFDDPRSPRLFTGVYGHDIPLAAVDA